MFANCPKCAGYCVLPDEGDDASCGVCGAIWEPTREQLRRARAERESERLREARLPFCRAGSVAIFLVTAALLFLIAMPLRPLRPLAMAAPSLLPVWIAILAG